MEKKQRREGEQEVLERGEGHSILKSLARKGLTDIKGTCRKGIPGQRNGECKLSKGGARLVYCRGARKPVFLEECEPRGEAARDDYYISFPVFCFFFFLQN